MSTDLLGKAILVSTLLLGTSFTVGCATVVGPLKPEATTMMWDPDHGLVFGRIHVTENGKDQRAGIQLPLDLKWLVTEEHHGNHILLDQLPIDGPFAVKLPIGSYRVTAVNLDITLGMWHASLPTRFTVQSRACTYLGTWDLDMQAGFFTGSINRRVKDQQQRDEGDLWKLIGAGSCSVVKAPLATPMSASEELVDRVEGTELTSPP